MNYGSSSVSVWPYYVSSTTYSITYTTSTTSSVFYSAGSYYPSPSPKIPPSCEAEVEGLISFEED